MEGFGGSRFEGVSVKKRRSIASRRPRPDSLPLFESRERSSPSSTPSSDNVGKISSDENAGYDSIFRRKDLNLDNSASASRVSYSNRAECEIFPKKMGKIDERSGEFDGFYSNGGSRGGSSTRNEQVRNALDLKRCSEGVLAPANWKNSNKVQFQSRTPDSYISNRRNGDSSELELLGAVSNGSGNRGEASSHENKLRKVKLKVGGVTCTIHAKTTPDGVASGSSSTKPPRSDTPRHRQKLILQDNSDDDHSPPHQVNGLQGISWKNFGGASCDVTSKEDLRRKMKEENLSSKQTDKSNEAVRKSKRVPKRRVLDSAFDDGDADDEIRYLERLKTAKAGVDYGAEYEVDTHEDNRKRKFSKACKSRIVNAVYDEDVEEHATSRSFKEGKRKSRSEKDPEDMHFVEEDEDLGQEFGPEFKRKKQKKELLDSLADGKKEPSLTTRQRALQSGKDAFSGNAANLVEFPNGLPPAPPRKQKEKLSEVEQQLKKAEAAQRRRMQVEKAARESEAEAIRKIRGLDSSKNKREDKIRKRRDELAQEKAANAIALASNTVRWVMGPTGTVVMFPKDLGLPNIFDTKQSSYPPPRDKCAGPSCTNAYKYRDSKSKLPLCSLQCYKAIHGVTKPVTTC